MQGRGGPEFKKGVTRTETKKGVEKRIKKIKKTGGGKRQGKKRGTVGGR